VVVEVEVGKKEAERRGRSGQRLTHLGNDESAIAIKHAIFGGVADLWSRALRGYSGGLAAVQGQQTCRGRGDGWRASGRTGLFLSLGHERG
jgi:hypothetical protein